MWRFPLGGLQASGTRFRRHPSRYPRHIPPDVAVPLCSNAGLLLLLVILLLIRNLRSQIGNVSGEPSPTDRGRSRERF